MKKYFWKNNWVFILAAIGSAAGLGSLWRFPYLAYENGGGAFVFAFIVINIVVGIPFLILEIGFGQMTQAGVPNAFAYIKKKFRYIGWMIATISFVVLSYYMIVISWGINYLGASLSLGWGGNPGSFFSRNILGSPSGVDAIGNISLPVLIGLIVAWVVMYFIVRNGVQSISKVIVWTATLPFIILIILMLRIITIDGAINGLKLFLIPDWKSLLSPKLWLDAFSQVFFSLSLAFGVMITYGSLKKHSSEITKSALWIISGNLLVSLISGSVVFGTLGYMALKQGVQISNIITNGPALLFVVFPQAINLLPTLSKTIAILFFGSFVMLAINGAMSLLEVITLSFNNKYSKTSSKKITFFIVIAGMLSGIIFTTANGVYFLDIVDHYIINYGLVTMGILEILTIGWILGTKNLENFINNHSKIKIGRNWRVSIKYIIPILLTWLLMWNIVNEFNVTYGGYPKWAILYIGILPLFIIPIVSFVLEKITSKKA